MWISARCPLLRAALLHGGSGNRRDSSTREPEPLPFVQAGAHAAKTSTLLPDPAEKSASRRKTRPAEKRHVSLRSALGPSLNSSQLS